MVAQRLQGRVQQFIDESIKGDLQLLGDRIVHSTLLQFGHQSFEFVFLDLLRLIPELLDCRPASMMGTFSQESLRFLLNNPFRLGPLLSSSFDIALADLLEIVDSKQIDVW